MDQSAGLTGFAAQLDPTLEEINDIKTAVSEAVTNATVSQVDEAAESAVV